MTIKFQTDCLERPASVIQTLVMHILFLICDVKEITNMHALLTHDKL